jgi:DNA-binding response OmpR family regulator
LLDEKFSLQTMIQELGGALTEQFSLHEEFDVVAVETGSHALQAAKQVDVLVLEVGLTDIDGRDVVE